MERTDQEDAHKELALLVRQKFVECVNERLEQLKDTSSAFKTALKQSITPSCRFTLAELDDFHELIEQEASYPELTKLAYAHYLFNVKYEPLFTLEMAERCAEYIYALSHEPDFSISLLLEEFASNCVRGLSKVITFEEL